MTALMTLLVLENIGWEVPLRSIRTGFALAQWPGRLQVVQHDPLVLLDVAHNPDGSRNLKKAIREFFPGRKVSFVLGVQEDKEFKAMIRHLAPVAERFYLTRASWKGAAKPAVLARVVKDRGLPCRTYAKVPQALQAAIGSVDEIVCVTGSHYVVGEAMEELGIQP
jgi:dihydrofolate synthase/folylpolyglutamate synthase